MSDNGVVVRNPGEQDFAFYFKTLEPNEVILPEAVLPGQRQYGVTVHHPARQWEIVAVEPGRRRHVAFIAAVYCLDQVLGLAGGIGRELPAALA
jgi:hypothetical protein